MPLVAILILAYLALNVIVAIALIGKPRDPRTPIEAVAVLVELSLVAAGVVYLAS